MHFEELLQFVERDMRMSHVYQPVMLRVLIENRLSFAIRDKYPVTDWHILVVPKRHTSDYFDLGTAESRACHRLIAEARSLVCKADPAVMGFNVGINSGQVAGSTK